MPVVGLLKVLEQRASGLGWSKIDFSITSDKANTFISLPDAGLLRRIAGNGMCESPLLPSFFASSGSPLRHRRRRLSTLLFSSLSLSPRLLPSQSFMSPSCRCSLSDSPVSEFPFSVLRPALLSFFPYFRCLRLLSFFFRPFLHALRSATPSFSSVVCCLMSVVPRILRVLTVSHLHMYISSLILGTSKHPYPDNDTKRLRGRTALSRG